MKQFKTLTTLFCLLAVLLFSSCLSSNESSSFDDADFMTVKTLGPTVDRLIGDRTGETYYPINPSALKVKNPSTGEEKILERALVYFSYVEADKNKKSKSIRVESCMPIPVLEFNAEKDTLDLETKGVAFQDVAQPFASSEYITFNFYFKHGYYSSVVNIDDFMLYIEDSNEDTLFLNFIDYRDKSANLEGQPQQAVISYKMDPGLIAYKCPNLDTSDSINVVVQYTKNRDEIVKTSPIKILLE